MNSKPFQFSLFAIFAFVTWVCLILAFPSTVCIVSASLPATVLGFACIQSALEHRLAGWISGLVFGVLIMLSGFVGVGIALCQ